MELKDKRFTIKPDMIDLSNGIIGSDFGDAKIETSACKLIKGLSEKGLGFDDWFIYKKKNKITSFILNLISGTDISGYITGITLRNLSPYLEKKYGRYRVTEEFVKIVSKFIKRESE